MIRPDAVTDIIERLRMELRGDRHADLAREAADEIERLRAKIAQLHAEGASTFREAADRIKQQGEEIERLRAADKLARQFSGVGLIGALENENGRLREILRVIWVSYQDDDGIRKIFHEAGFPWPEWERLK